MDNNNEYLIHNQFVGTNFRVMLYGSICGVASVLSDIYNGQPPNLDVANNVGAIGGLSGLIVGGIDTARKLNSYNELKTYFRSSNI